MKLRLDYPGLCRVISGGQTGSDQAGLHVAREFDLQTGGHIPREFKTQAGSMPELAEQFGLVAIASDQYPPRTRMNVNNSDATVRLASNFNSPGEKLTLKYCQLLNRPSFDVLLDGREYLQKAAQLAEFIITNNVVCLNVAGNSDRSDLNGFHFRHASHVLTETFRILKEIGVLKS